MKHMNYYLLVSLIGLASGCAFKRQNVVLAPVGPPHLVEGIPGARDGGVAVYSALNIGNFTPGELEEVPYHSGYKIYSADGKVLKTVNNKVGSYVEDPPTVSLPPGHYTVVARASAFGIVTVPVVIEAGKTTFVHLNGSELTVGRQTATSEFVRLPDGLIVGWRAKQNEETK